MSGLVAVVSVDRSSAVSEPDVESLARAYESLRGEGTRRAYGGAAARVIRFGHGLSENGIERSGYSWVATAGAAHTANGSLIPLRLADLDGQFALVSFDAEQDEVCVAADPFGMHALYVASRPGRSYVSTSALALAKHLRARPSRLGLFTFLRAGAHFGTMTNWEGIERVEPGVCLRFTPHGAKRDFYWRPQRDPRVAALDFDGTVDHCLDVTTDAFKRTFGDYPSVWTDLTGGFDTRLLNSLLARAGVQFRTNTRDEEAGDVRLSRLVSRAAGWDSVHLALPGDWADTLDGMVSSALAWGDGNLEVLELAWVLWAHRELRRVSPVLLSGGGGEHLQYHAWKSEFLNMGRSSRVDFDNWVDMRLLRPVNTDLFALDPTPEVRSDLRRRMKAWVEPYVTELNTTQLDLLYAYKMTGHCGAYLSADHAYLSPELPYYLKDVFTTALSTNHRFRGSHRLMRNMLERLDPRLAAVTTTSGGTAQPLGLSNVHRFAPYYGTLLRKATNKVTQKLGVPVMPTVAHFDPAPPPARQAVLSSLAPGRPLTASDLRSGPLYRRAAIEDLLHAARGNDRVDSALLGRVLTVELALRFVDSSVEG